MAAVYRKMDMDPILIVDDEPDNLDALQRLLRTEYEVVTASSPVEALRQVVTRQFNVVVSDQRMPEMTGVEFLEKVKGAQPQAVRILLTGYTDVESVIGAINRGQIYRYIAKPWDPEDLKMTLRQANEAYSLRRELENRNAALTAANSKLESALRELRGLDAAKARFLSLVSHELNTPLTVIGSFVPLLSEAKLSGDAAKAVDAIILAANRLSSVVSEVVDFTRIEVSPTLNRTAVPIGTLLQDSVKAHGQLVKEKKIRIDFKGDQAINGNWDRTRLNIAFSKVLFDLLVQAPRASVIEIECQDSGAEMPDGDGVIIEYRRGGGSISAHAFEKLDFGGDPLKHRQNLGLGLALFKTVIEAHGGRLSVSSNSSFPAIIRVELPRSG